MMMNCSNDFEKKVAVVTGAGGVLCSEFAIALARNGAKVALLDINIEKIQALAKLIVSNGGIAKAYKANVLDKDMLSEVKEEINKDFGNIDILLNGAGGNSSKGTTTKEVYEKGDDDKDIKTFFNLDMEGIRFVFDLNFLGILLPSQVFCKDMTIGGGTIINISSMNAFTPLTKIPAYSAAKAAVSNFTKWLAVHFAGVGIRVNAIAPGFFATEQNHSLLYDEKGILTERSHKILRNTPMGRFGKPEELVEALLFLANDKKASFITGNVMEIDGGFNAFSGV